MRLPLAATAALTIGFVTLPTDVAHADNVNGTGSDTGASLSGVRKDTSKATRTDIDDPPVRRQQPRPHSRIPSKPKPATSVKDTTKKVDGCSYSKVSYDDSSGPGNPHCAVQPVVTKPFEVVGKLSITPTRPSVDDITEEAVQKQIVNVPFPKLAVHVEPHGITLVNLDTNVYTIPVPFQRTVTVATWPVKARATPTSYTWHFGDGTDLTTTSPGAPYPDGDVTHQYLHRIPKGTTLSVTVHYAARFRPPGRDWREIAGDIPLTGPATALRVCEARPVLTDPDGSPDADPADDPAGACAAN